MAASSIIEMALNTVIADTKPFTMAEAHYDVKFYLKKVFLKDSLSIHGKKYGEHEQSWQKGKKGF